VRTHLHNLAIIAYGNHVRVADGGEPVRHDDGGPLLGRQQVVKGLLHDALGLAVERAGRFVEEQDLRIFDDRPRDRDPLLLTT